VRRLVSLVVLVACSENAPETVVPGAPVTPEEAESAIAALVPADAVAVVRVRSLASFARLQSKLLHVFDARLVHDARRGLADRTGVPAAQIDEELPLAVGVSLQAAAPAPHVTWILPVHDPRVAAEDWHAGKATRSRYVALSADGSFAPGEGRLSAPRGGEVTLRLDLATLVASTRSSLDMTLGLLQGAAVPFVRRSFPGVDAERRTAELFRFLADALDSAESLDVVVSEERGTLRIDTTFRAMGGSPLAKSPGRASALPRRAPKELTQVVVGRVDPGWLPAGVPEPLRRAIEACGGEALVAFDGARWFVAGPSKDGASPGFLRASDASLLEAEAAPVDLGPIEGELLLFARLELRALFRMLGRPPRDGGPIRAGLSLSRSGRVWRLRTQLDLEAAATLYRAPKSSR